MALRPAPAYEQDVAASIFICTSPMPAIRKPLGEITADDLRTLISDGWAEDEQLEFKETLPSKGATRDAWLVNQSEVGTVAKRDVLAEVVGMANSYGGDVILGLKEREVLPHRAEALALLPKCLDLARRFEMFARDHVKPEIPLLAVRGIPIDGESGVIVIRVPRSDLAPHRLEIAGVVKDCYKRVRDRTEVMSMREIQDLTLDRERGSERVERRSRELRARYEEFCNHKHFRDTFQSAYSYSICALPLSPSFSVRRVHGVKEIIPVTGDSYLRFQDGRVYQCIDSLQLSPWTPMLRGTRAMETNREWRSLIELTADGAYLACTCQPTEKREQEKRAFFIGWLFAAIVNAGKTVDALRRYSGSESVEFALEIEMNVFSSPHRVLGFGAEQLTRHALATLSEPLRLPKYSLGPTQERAELLTGIYEDVLSGLGRDSKTDRIVEVDCEH